MWQLSALSQNPGWLDTATNSQFKIITSEVVVPSNVATPIEVVADAQADSARRADFDLLKSDLEAIAITPWHQGLFNGSKQDANFYLSPSDAQNILAAQLELINWESCVVVMVAADNAPSLAGKLESLVEVFPHESFLKSLRQAQALASHESQKIFVPGIKQDDRKKGTIEKMGGFSALLVAKQNLAISEAVASDGDTKTLLTDFKNKRIARLDEIKQGVESLANQNGPIENVLHLSGGDLASQLTNVSAPNQNAPLCCLLAMGGGASDLAPLLEVLGL
jgi:hypothetical protein